MCCVTYLVNPHVRVSSLTFLLFLLACLCLYVGHDTCMDVAKMSRIRQKKGPVKTSNVTCAEPNVAIRYI